MKHNCLIFVGFSTGKPPGYELINDQQESNLSFDQLVNKARGEVGQQISHYVGNSEHSNSAPSVIQAHINTSNQSIKQLGQTNVVNDSVIRDIREFLSDYSRRNNQSTGASVINSTTQQDRLLKSWFLVPKKYSNFFLKLNL